MLIDKIVFKNLLAEKIGHGRDNVMTLISILILCNIIYRTF